MCVCVCRVTEDDDSSGVEGIGRNGKDSTWQVAGDVAGRTTGVGRPFDTGCRSQGFGGSYGEALP